ncbi:MAG TPA: hypothetical protein VN951_06410 [Pyrinomonadaceae bacterium]|nr:hypothetical protein [Pyrinomonadaceae bacterium]
MTLKEAVRILSERNHRGASDWLISGTQVTGSEPFRVVGKEIDPKNLTAFEAIAIAEKYVSGATPETVAEQAKMEKMHSKA